MLHYFAPKYIKHSVKMFVESLIVVNVVTNTAPFPLCHFTPTHAFYDMTTMN